MLLLVKEIAEIFKQISAAAYVHVISCTKHEEDTATEVYLELCQIFMMELFYKYS